MPPYADGRPEHREPQHCHRSEDDGGHGTPQDRSVPIADNEPSPCRVLRGSAFARRCHAALSERLPSGSRLSARRRADRIARLEQLGRRRHAQRHRQAAARQRPASGRASSRPPGTSRTCRPATSTSSARRCPARRRSRSAATASSPGARPTSRPTSRISIASGSTRAGRFADLPRRAGAADDRPRDDRGQRRRACLLRRPHHASRPARLGRHQRQQRRRGTPDGPQAGAARAAGPSLDRARRATTRRSPRS